MWHVPWNVVQIIRRRRSLQPAIRVYAGALALGLLLGLAANVLLSVPWWMLALAVVGAVWLFFLGTAFIGPGRAQPLHRELMDVVWPRGRQERRERDDEEAFRTSGIPVLAVSGWRGPGLRQWPLVRILPGDAAIEIDRRRERRMRPSAVVELLRRAQQAGPRFKAGPFWPAWPPATTSSSPGRARVVVRWSSWSTSTAS